MQKSILATATGLVLFATTAMAQVEQPSQINIQGTALITKDSTTDSATHGATQSGGLLVGYSYRFNQWAGVVFKAPDFTLNLDKVTHLAQPSVGFYFRY